MQPNERTAVHNESSMNVLGTRSAMNGTAMKIQRMKQCSNRTGEIVLEMSTLESQILRGSARVSEERNDRDVERISFLPIGKDRLRPGKVGTLVV